MVGPNYKEPKIKTPKEFKEVKKQKNASLSNFWKKFNDPILDKLIDKALQGNFDVRIAKEKICQLRAIYRVTKADLFPQINANARAIRSKISENLTNSRFLGTQYQNFFDVGFDAIWELDFFGKIRREKQSATYAVQAQEEQTNDIQLSITAEVARFYVDIRYIQKKMQLFEELRYIEKELFTLYSDRFKAGIDSLILAEESFASYQNLSSEIPRLDQALMQNFYSLLSLLGKNPEQMKLTALKQGPIPMIQGKVFGVTPSSLLRRRPDIRYAERLLAQATANIGVAVADLFPSFSLVGDVGKQSAFLNKLFNNPSTSWNIGSLLNWPIISFGKVRGNIDEKKSIQKQALLTYEKTIIEGFKDVENAFVAYFDEVSHLKFAYAGFDAKLKQQHLHHSLYESGVEDRLQFLQAKKEALNQENLVVDSKKTLSTNLISLYKAMGGGF